MERLDAKSITDKVLQFLDENKIDRKRMVMFTSDGAAVMLGHKSGVAKQLREASSTNYLLDMHCVAHREALAIKDVLNVYYTLF